VFHKKIITRGSQFKNQQKGEDIEKVRNSGVLFIFI
jgi:hypothetical protein